MFRPSKKTSSTCCSQRSASAFLALLGIYGSLTFVIPLTVIELLGEDALDDLVRIVYLVQLGLALAALPINLILLLGVLFKRRWMLAVWVAFNSLYIVASTAISILLMMEVSLFYLANFVSVSILGVSIIVVFVTYEDFDQQQDEYRTKERRS